MSMPKDSESQAFRAVTTPAGALHVTDHEGAGPAIVMMHGFPDDSRIYDHLVPLLKPYRAVTFDWLGYGHSDRTDTTRITSAGHQAELGAVLDGLGIDRVILVGHDASGPDAIDYALRHRHRVARLVLLNTYYGNAPSLRFPEMIRLLADQDLERLADAILADPDQRLRLLLHTARRFGFDGDSLDPQGVGVTSVIPQFFGDADQPDALAAIRAWTRTLPAALAQQDATIASGALAALDIPVTLIFGPGDEYLSPVLAAHLSGLFNNSTVHLADGASHWPQWDQPEVVAQLIKGDSSPPATTRTTRKEHVMFAGTKAFSAFAVDDLAQARKFYGETLGIRVSGQNGLLTLHLAGGHDARVYPKADHTPASYTILMFRVDDIEAAVGELADRGVRFERYDGMDQDERGITRDGGPFIAAWFKDPAGNILEVLQER